MQVKLSSSTLAYFSLSISMQKTWGEVLQRLLDEDVLIEDNIGVIQIHPTYYAALGRTLPGAVNPNKTRAEKLAQSYIDLWPKKIMSGGRPIRQGPTAITKKLNGFMNKNPKITDEQILDATRRYVNMKQKDNWEFATCSDYFISKGNTSLLESYVFQPELGSKDQKSAPAMNQRFI